MENKRSGILRNTVNRRKRKPLAALGFLVLAFALVGLITVGISSMNLTGRILDNTKEKQKLEHFILPVIMFDPMTFDSPQEADPLMVLQSAVWSALLSRDRNDLPFDDYGSVQLSVSDVEVQAAKLYGADITLSHQSFGGFESPITYNEEKQLYSIPLASQMAVYTPKILDITHKGEIYTLEVGYIPPGNLWTTDAEGNTYEPDPDKIMLMELRKVKNGYNVVALKDGPDTNNQTAPQTPGQVTPELPGDIASGYPRDPEAPGESQGGDSASSEDEAPSTDPPRFPSVSASSSTPDGIYHTYGPNNAVDDDWDTAWIEGKDDDGIGEYLLFEADKPQTVKGFTMTNGYTENLELYNKNNRITKVQLEFSDGTTLDLDTSVCTTLFPDGKPGEFTFDEPVVTKSIKIIIMEIESGNTYQDSCISEVTFF